MIQDCASRNKIKENKYKILRMSLLLGTDDDKEETLNNFEDASREIDSMNDEIYLKDLEDKFYDTKTLEEEEKKLELLVDYIGGRVEQRISLLSDFANVTGFDLTNLPPIKFYDKLDDYKERLKYVKEYLENTKQIEQLNAEIKNSEDKLKESYMNKANSEECNNRNEEILTKKFNNIIKALDSFKDVNEDNIDSKLNGIIDSVQESKKSLDIFNKSFTTLRGSGISYAEEEEYLSYVNNAKDIFYANKEQEYLLRIYKFLLTKESEYNSILMKREAINDILNERIILRQELNITDTDVLTGIYEIIDRQYEDIKRQKDNIDNIEILSTLINQKNEQLMDLEQDNQKVEILALLREYGMIDTYMNESTSSFNTEENSVIQEDATAPISTQENNIFMNPTLPEKEFVLESKTNDIFSNSNNQQVSDEKHEDNEVIAVVDATNIDLDYIHSKAGKVMKRVGEMLGIKTEEKKIMNVESDELFPKAEPKKVESIQPTKSEPLLENPQPIENPLFTTPSEMPFEKENPLFANQTDENNFWFPSDTPDALNELPDLDISNDDFFANNQMPDLNFPDLQMNFMTEESEDK